MAKNQYILFAGLNYYPAGTDDIIGCFPTMDEAFDAWLKRLEETENDDWACIFDVDTQKVSYLRQ